MGFSIISTFQAFKSIIKCLRWRPHWDIFGTYWLQNCVSTIIKLGFWNDTLPPFRIKPQNFSTFLLRASHRQSYLLPPSSHTPNLEMLTHLKIPSSSLVKPIRSDTHLIVYSSKLTKTEPSMSLHHSARRLWMVTSDLTPGNVLDIHYMENCICVVLFWIIVLTMTPTCSSPLTVFLIGSNIPFNATFISVWINIQYLRK